MKDLILQNITQNIILIEGLNHGRFPHSHSILILDEERVLIDTGCGIDTLQRLKQEFAISYIINSHTHPDHSAGNWIFEKHPIHVPREGFKTSGDLKALSRRFVGTKLAPRWQEFAQQTMGFQSCRPTHAFSKEKIFQTGKLVLTPIYTPGHTIDHYCLFEKTQRILLSFDYDLTSFPWYGHAESDLSAFRQSIHTLKALNPKLVISSHKGLFTTDIRTKFNRYANHLDERNERILSLLETEKTLENLVDLAPIYRKYPYEEPLLRYWEAQMIMKHLTELLSQSRVIQQGNKYRKI
jgi:glyoxylase-like metal-dependent hydrolase (beta-lactamase superfamily II)